MNTPIILAGLGPLGTPELLVLALMIIPAVIVVGVILLIDRKRKQNRKQPTQTHKS